MCAREIYSLAISRNFLEVIGALLRLQESSQSQVFSWKCGHFQNIGIQADGEFKAKFSKLHKSSLSTATGLNMCSIDLKYFPTCFLMFWRAQRYQLHTLQIFLAKLLVYFDVKTHLTKPFVYTTIEAKIVILVSNLENHLNTVSSRFVISK